MFWHLAAKSSASETPFLLQKVPERTIKFMPCFEVAFTPASFDRKEVQERQL